MPLGGTKLQTLAPSSSAGSLAQTASHGKLKPPLIYLGVACSHQSPGTEWGLKCVNVFWLQDRRTDVRMDEWIELIPPARPGHVFSSRWALPMKLGSTLGLTGSSRSRRGLSQCFCLWLHVGPQTGQRVFIIQIGGLPAMRRGVKGVGG